MAQQTTRRFLRLPEVKKISGYKRTAIYDKIQRGEFPKPYPIGARAVAWLSTEVEAWIDKRIQAARGAR